MSFSRTAHRELSAPEGADRLAIRELLDAYAHCADRRDVEGQLSLFAADAEVLLFMGRRPDELTGRFNGRDALRPLFDSLKTFEATTHFNGQNTLVWGEASATGELNCLAHLVKADGTDRTLTVSAVRYLDRFVKQDGLWFFQKRQAVQDWVSVSPLSTVTPLTE